MTTITEIDQALAAEEQAIAGKRAAFEAAKPTLRAAAALDAGWALPAVRLVGPGGDGLVVHLAPAEAADLVAALRAMLARRAGAAP